MFYSPRENPEEETETVTCSYPVHDRTKPTDIADYDVESDPASDDSEDDYPLLLNSSSILEVGESAEVSDGETSSDTEQQDDQASNGTEEIEFFTDNSDSSEESEESVEQSAKTVTRSGRAVKPARKLIEEMGNISMGEICLAAVEKFVEEDDPEQVGVTEAEANYFDRMMEIDNGKTVMGEILATAIERNGGGTDEEFQTWAIKMLGEVNAVGAGIGGGIENTAELR
eukprot:scaffold4406_cov54-Cylindrotheca_fusiformis.AAC.1